MLMIAVEETLCFETHPLLGEPVPIFSGGELSELYAVKSGVGLKVVSTTSSRPSPKREGHHRTASALRRVFYSVRVFESDE